MRDLYAELLEVTEALERAQIPYALVGGLAYSIYVEPRATEDLDLLILPDDWEKCVEALRPHGWLDAADPMNFEKVRIRRLTKLSEEGALVCDFLLADAPYHTGITDRNRIARDGTELYLAPPEVLVKLKRARMSEKDRGDIEGLQRLIDGEED